MQAFESSLQIASQSELLIWQSLQREKNDPAYTLAFRFKIKSTISFFAVQKSISRLLNDHCPGLCYQFFERKNILYKQFVVPSKTPVLRLTKEQRIHKTIFSEELIPLYYFAWRKGEMIIQLSHLVIDGGCYDDFCSALQRAFVNKPIPIISLNSKKSQPEKKSLDFWENYLKHKLLHQPLPFLMQAKESNLVAVTYPVPNALYNKLKHFNTQHKASLFQTLTTALTILLYHYVRDEEEGLSLALSYCVSTREPDDPVACYFNLLPLLIACNSNETALEILNKIKKLREQQKPHQRIVLNQLLSFVDEKMNRNQSLLNVVINHSPGLLPVNHPKIGEVSTIESCSGAKNFSLVYNFNEQDFIFRLESNCGSLFTEMMEQIAVNLAKTLDFIVAQTDSPIGDLGFSQERKSISTGRSLDNKTQPLFDYFLHQARRQIDKIALRSLYENITYQTMIDSVYRLKSVLLQLDATVLERGIGIYLPRNSSLPIALLACLAIQRPFIPLSQELPVAVLNEIIAATRMGVILMDEKNSSIPFADLSLQILNLQQILAEEMEPQQHPDTMPLSEEIAYIIFTSGSTGRPKGVKVSYDNLFNFLRSMAANPGLTEQDTLLAMTPISFDISINELLLPLFCGATVFIVDEFIRKDTKSLTQLIDEHDITTIQATPSSMQLFKQISWKSKHQELRFWVGGEAFPVELADYFINQQHRVFNMYGPTETTIWVATTRVQKNKLITLGRAMDNSALYVVNKAGKTLPLGMVGELLVTGAQVAKGYSNVTSSAFLNDADRVPGYLTGDKVIAIAQDHIMFLKRSDEQIKVRGHRVELLEINQKISALQTDINPVTILRLKPTPHLCTFYTAPNPYCVDTEKILNHLKNVLPDYKIPQAIIYLPTFPLNNSGKINKKALETIELTTLINFVAPQTEVQTLSRNELEILKIIDCLKTLIKEEFDLNIKDNHTPLSQYGFNSLTFNSLAISIEKHLGVTIKTHEFYRWGNLYAISQRCCTHHSQNSDNSINRIKPVQPDNKKRIAIIGYDALMPAGLDAEGLWEALITQQSLISSHQREWLAGKEKAGFISHIDHFDRRFFNLSPLEVLRMDPRQRLLLQCAYKTIEHAGYAASSLKGKKVGCFVAGTGMDYLVAQEKYELKPHPYTLSGNTLTMLPNRLSYYFDWHGPSLFIDTACSAALSALIRAIESIRLGNTQLCFVAAANLIVDHHLTEALGAGNFLSPRAECASFSDKADGYVRGEGIIGFLLKPFDQAIVDHDDIHAVIETATENHGGRAQSLTAPNQEAQTSLLLDAYHDELLCERLSFIETHGTGTKLGDPIEIDALKSFERRALVNNKQNSIYLGAMKSNIGHLEAAAGFASILKIILAMKHKMIPGNIHGHSLNPLIVLQDSKFAVIAENTHWNAESDAVAGVSAFGFGGANAHVVLSAYQNLTGTYDHDEPLLFVLSAKSKNALRARIHALIKDIEKYEEQDLKNIAYTLVLGREVMPHRLVLVAQHRKELLAQLQHVLQVQEEVTVDMIPLPFKSLVEDFLAHKEVDWRVLFVANDYQRLSLTPYVFDEEPFWFTSLAAQQEGDKSLLKMLDISRINPYEIQIKIRAEHPFLAEHQVFQQRVLPGVVHIELALYLLRLNNTLEFPVVVEHFYWLRPVICLKAAVYLTVTASPMQQGFHIELKDEEGILYSRGSFHRQATHILTDSWFKEIQNSLTSPLVTNYTAHQIYQAFSKSSIDYGKYFQGIEKAVVLKNYAKGYLNLNPCGSLVTLLDSAFQSGMAISLNTNQQGLMPFTLGSMTLLSDQLWQLTKARIYTQKLSPFRTHFIICDDADSPQAVIVDLGVKSGQMREKA